MDVHGRLARHLLVDGYRLVLDLERSRGSRLVDARHRPELPGLLHLLRLGPPGGEPPSRRRSGVPGAARQGRREQARQLRSLHRPPRRLRRDVRPGARRPRAAAPVLRGRRRPRRGERAQGAPSTGRAVSTPRGGAPRRLGTKVLHLHPRLPRAQRLHALADEHRPDQDRPLPEVRLAQDRGRPRSATSARRRGGRGALPGRGAGGLRRPPPRHRLLHRRADPGRGRRQTTCGRSSCSRWSGSATSTTPSSSWTRCRPARGHRDPLGAPAAGPRARRRGLRQEGPGGRDHGGPQGRRRCPATCSRSAAGSTPPGAAGWSTWSAPAGCWRSWSATA